MHWLASNYQWLIAVAVMPIILLLLKQWADSRKKTTNSVPVPQATLNVQDSQVSNSPVASGSNNSQVVNSPTLNLSLSTDEGQSNWPDVILECQWPSLVHESRIPGSHIVRRRPWVLHHKGLGAVYNVIIRRIDLGEYEAVFPFPVRTLTDTASVYPIICQKSDGAVINPHDLESVIHDPPSGCDVHQYASEVRDEDGDEIPMGPFILEVDIPITISYDDKIGNRFKIKYRLHYDTYMEKGEMIRASGIEKVAPIKAALQ